MPVLAHKLRTFQPAPPPPPTPEQQQLQQLQLQAAQLTVQKLQAEIGLLQSKAGMENARKDMTNLDYVETETGTRHARDIQLAETKAQGQKELQAQNTQGQQHLAVTKALTTPTKEGDKAPNLHAAIGFNHLSKTINL
jgi:hypothetical protein